jgi:hypothetical protein
MFRTTVISPCQQYRYTLWRSISEWCPSYADHSWLETTLREPNFHVAYGAERICRHCGKHEYADFTEGRIGGPWRGVTKTVAFIGLNPSTADATKDDPTIRKCKGFAKRWGMDWMVMLNLFAFRATVPAHMKKAADPVGPENDDYFGRILPKVDLIVCAWGVHGAFKNNTRVADASALFAQLHGQWKVQCLGSNDDGSPKHPLYVPYETPLRDYPDYLGKLY